MAWNEGGGFDPGQVEVNISWPWPTPPLLPLPLSADWDALSNPIGDVVNCSEYPPEVRSWNEGGRSDDGPTDAEADVGSAKAIFRSTSCSIVSYPEGPEGPAAVGVAVDVVVVVVCLFVPEDCEAYVSSFRSITSSILIPLPDPDPDTAVPDPDPDAVPDPAAV